MPKILRSWIFWIGEKQRVDFIFENSRLKIEEIFVVLYNFIYSEKPERRKEMARKTKTDIEVEEFIIVAFEAGFNKLLLYLYEEAFKIGEEIGGFGLSKEEMRRELERRAKKQIIEKFRTFFNQLIIEKNIPLFMISYYIKRCEGALEELKARGTLQVFVPEELNFLIPKMHLFVREYIEILEETLLWLKFEYEVI